MQDEQSAKHLLSGASCLGCKYTIGSMCSLFEPIDIKYKNDVQVFVSGVLLFDGIISGSNQIIMIGDKIYINQMVIGAAHNSGDTPLIGGESIQVFSRGIDKDGNYECQKISKIYEHKPWPKENFCKYWITS